ncbi:MAG: hypothetical protein Tsb007_20810 [Rhizobacter sp.]
METAPFSPASSGALRDLLRDASLIQASQYFDGNAVTLGEPQDLRLGQVLKRYMAMVILNGVDLRIVIKVHFDLEPIRTYRQSRLAPESDLADKKIIDFMKELSNQIGGRVCRAFDTHGTPAGMSVPLCTRGIYEIYADYTPRSGALEKFGDFWRLDSAFGSIYCSSYVELLAKRDYSGVTCSCDDAQEGELDFL